MSDDLFETPNEAKARAEAIGCVGYHAHEVDGSVMFMPCDSMGDYEQTTAPEVTKAEWDAAYRNALPDTAFFYIEPGGEKVDGITTPLSLRKLPYRNASGQPDLPHLRAVLSRLSSADIPEADKAKIRTEARQLLEQATTEKAFRKDYDGIDFVPPKGVQDAAELGLALRREHNRGGTAIGIARARDLHKGKDASPEAIRRMASFFSRHKEETQKSDTGRIAWLLRGGESGNTWAAEVSAKMRQEDLGKIIYSTGELDSVAQLKAEQTIAKSIHDFAAGTDDPANEFLLSILPPGERHQVRTTKANPSGPEHIRKQLPRDVVVDLLVTASGQTIAIDLLYANGVAVTGLPYSVRKELLIGLLDGRQVEAVHEVCVQSAADVVLIARQAYDSDRAAQANLRSSAAVYEQPATILELSTEREALWKFVPPTISESPAALFVTGAPNEIESILGKPLAGADGATFKSAYLDRLGLAAKDVTVAHSTPSIDSTDMGWGAWLAALLKKHDGLPVIALGKTASTALGEVEHITMPHPRAVRIKGDRGEIARKAKRIRKAIEENNAPGHMCPIFKADDEKRIVYGIVLEPDSVDLQGDVLALDTIENAAHKYLIASRLVGDGHSQKAEAEVVESYLAPTDVELGGQVIRQGTWVMGVKVLDDSMWQAVKDGEYTGFSIGGRGERKEIQTDGPPENLPAQ